MIASGNETNRHRPPKKIKTGHPLVRPGNIFYLCSLRLTETAMSVILNFAMFPTDKGASASPWVSKILKMIDESGVDYKLNPMGTSIETEKLEEALAIVQRSYELLEPDCERVYSAITIDIRKGKSNRMKGKIESIESKIGKINH